MTSTRSKLLEASTIVARQMRQVEGLEYLERELLISGRAAYSLAGEGHTEAAERIGHTIDVGIRAMAALLYERPGISEIGSRTDVRTWVIAYLRTRSRGLAACLPETPATFTRLLGRRFDA